VRVLRAGDAFHALGLFVFVFFCAVFFAASRAVWPLLF
jgi:hypothetical protein